MRQIETFLNYGHPDCAGPQEAQREGPPGTSRVAGVLRDTVMHNLAGGCNCAACGAGLREIGQDIFEVLEYEPGNFRVTRHVRIKLSCSACHSIVQAAAFSRPIDRGLAAAGLLAHVLVSKYTDHLPLYRQSQSYAREGVMLERSTLCDWLGSAARLPAPLARAVGIYVLQAQKIHSDDTPTRALGAGNTWHVQLGKTAGRFTLPIMTKTRNDSSISSIGPCAVRCRLTRHYRPRPAAAPEQQHATDAARVPLLQGQ